MTAAVLIVDDEAQYRDLYARALSAGGLRVLVAANAEEAARCIEAETPDLVVSDIRMPGQSGLELLKDTRARIPELPFLLITAYADVKDAVTALKLGAVDYLTKPVDLEELISAVQDALGLKAAGIPGDIPAAALRDITAESPAMQAVLRDAWLVAQSTATVLLTGESGTGKEVLARFIHANSANCDGSFVAVNCGAIPPMLLASELFGHAKGAFTGATASRLGYFREAGGGTLFLDEIGEMPLDLQPALLRAIESGTVMPVGSDQEVASAFRLLVATNRDLGADVGSKRFRQDLFYRINVVALELPPLRHRPEDILPLARRFLKHAAGDSRKLSRAASELLTRYAWPGNVRELSNAMERARLLSPGEIILPEHLPSAITDAPSAVSGPVKTLAQSEAETIRKALDETGGNRTRAAELLGITRRGLIYKLKRLGL